MISFHLNLTALGGTIHNIPRIHLQAVLLIGNQSTSEIVVTNLGVDSLLAHQSAIRIRVKSEVKCAK